eukprot:jgi/Chrpa1/17973/Chrysochromulina_OHIO_Genome00001756-RA
MVSKKEEWMSKKEEDKRKRLSKEEEQLREAEQNSQAMKNHEAEQVRQALEDEGTAAVSRLALVGTARSSSMDGWKQASVKALPALVERLSVGVSKMAAQRDSTSVDPTGPEASVVCELTTLLARIASASPACRVAIRQSGAAAALLPLLHLFPAFDGSAAATQCLTFLLYGDDCEQSSAVHILEVLRKHGVEQPLAAHKGLLSLLRPVAMARLIAAQNGSDVDFLEACMADARAVGVSQTLLDAGRERKAEVDKAALENERLIALRHKKKLQRTNVAKRDFSSSSFKVPDAAAVAAKALALAEAAEAVEAQAKARKAAEAKAKAEKAAKEKAPAPAPAAPAATAGADAAAAATTAAAGMPPPAAAAKAAKTATPAAEEEGDEDEDDDDDDEKEADIPKKKKKKKKKKNRKKGK